MAEKRDGRTSGTIAVEKWWVGSGPVQMKVRGLEGSQLRRREVGKGRDRKGTYDVNERAECICL